MCGECCETGAAGETMPEAGKEPLGGPLEELLEGPLKEWE